MISRGRYTLHQCTMQPVKVPELRPALRRSKWRWPKLVSSLIISEAKISMYLKVKFNQIKMNSYIYYCFVYSNVKNAHQYYDLKFQASTTKSKQAFRWHMQVCIYWWCVSDEVLPMGGVHCRGGYQSAPGDTPPNNVQPARCTCVC